MNFEVLANLSWRDGLVAIIVLLTIYVFVVFLRINRLRRAKENAPDGAFFYGCGFTSGSSAASPVCLPSCVPCQP